jgi:hypothetical protein
MGKPMGQPPIPVIYSQKPKKDPKGGQDPMISTSSFAPPLTGCQCPKIGQHDQESPKTWSRVNRPPTLTCDLSRVTLV